MHKHLVSCFATIVVHQDTRLTPYVLLQLHLVSVDYVVDEVASRSLPWQCGTLLIQVIVSILVLVDVTTALLEHIDLPFTKRERFLDGLHCVVKAVVCQLASEDEVVYVHSARSNAASISIS